MLSTCLILRKRSFEQMRKYILILISCIVLSCQNLENADPAPRNTFIKFYEGVYSINAVAVEKIPTGFVILANTNSITEKGLQVRTILIETDEQGNRIGDFHQFNNLTGKAFKPIINNGTVSKYIIVGDSTLINPTEQQAANVTITSLGVLVLDGSFGEEKRKYLKDNSNKEIKDDFFAGSISITNTGGAVVLGTFKEGLVNQQNTPEEQLLWGFDADLDSAWLNKFPLLSNTYSNAKSMHYHNGNLIWASAIADVQGDFISSYIAIPFVKEQSVPVNFSTIGETTSQRFLPQDIQPATSLAFGYGVVGTYSENTDGSKGNLFFLRVSVEGTIIPGSDRYFDGITSITEIATKNSSDIIDSGNAITGTSDGGFLLAGTITTNPSKGNGGKDILLIKVNAQGEQVWIKTMGGTGDEVPISVTEASGGDLIVCGTNTLSNYATAFLIRVDKNGELKN
jgi:hypothetical protein